jgi:crotonobetainyl-CoA:carnitine CoA-transferase CaiB-like acyl-CoA transferase
LVILNEDWLTKGALGIADIPRPFVSETPAKIGIAPTLGEHNDEVLQSIGYGTADIARLREQNII